MRLESCDESIWSEPPEARVRPRVLARGQDQARGGMTETDILAFARSLKSIWTIEILLCLARSSGRGWGRDELVRELRASGSVVAQGLQVLATAGLVTQREDATYSYAPASPFLQGLVDGLCDLYRTRPLAVTAAIFNEDSALQQFADAFRFRKDET